MAVGSYSQQLADAICADDTRTVQMLLARGADPNIQDEDGWLPVVLAAGLPHVRILEALLRHGADLHIKNQDGDTALHWAVRRQQVDAIRVLLRAGADPDETDDAGFTALMLAAFNGLIEPLEVLLKHGAPTETRDEMGCTALDWASFAGNSQAAALLIRNGAEIDAEDDNGFAAIHKAARAGSVETIELLVRCGAHVNHGAGAGITALHFAAKEGHAEVVELLLSCGADPTVGEDVGCTALDLAAQEGHEGIVRRLREAQTCGGEESLARPPRGGSQPVKRGCQLAGSSEVPSLEQLASELHGLIGLEPVKSDVAQLVDFLRLQNMRREKGLSVPEQSLHMVFTGSPGTGKTTIARLLAQIYRILGLLTRGHLVETDRSGLVAGYLGQTALKVREAVERSIGGVLFIDEAYSLAPGDAAGDQFGQEAVDTLLKLMEDYRHDLIVIVAGYTEPMARFIRSNPGLQSRFNKYLYFSDYSPTELAAIFQRFARQSDYKLTSESEDKVLHVFTQLHATRDECFGNARLARNLFEKSINNQATRLMHSSRVEDLVTLLPEDIPLPDCAHDRCDVNTGSAPALL